MKMPIQNLVVSLGLLTSAVSGFSAQTVDFTSCSKAGQVKTRCKLEKPVTLATLSEEMIATYDIKYRFPCKGHQTGLVFDAGEGRKPLAYTSSDEPTNTVTVDGPEELRFIDLDPTATYRATLVGDCHLTVESVSIAPSTKALEDWRQNATTQAKIIGLSLDRYALITDYKAYASWDMAQTQVMLESARSKIRIFETDCNNGDQTACRSAAHFRVLVGALEAKIAGTPVPPISDDDGAEIVESYKKDLEDEVETGELMVERFKRWELVVSEELKKVLESVKE